MTTATTPVFRVDLLTPDGWAGPFGGEHQADHPLVRGRTMSARCGKDPDHRPPAPECSCGAYGVRDVRSLLTTLIATEYNHDTQTLEGSDAGAWAAACRRMVVYGDLTHPRPAPFDPGGAALGAILADGRRTTHPRRGARIVRLATIGDPPGTVRGRKFTARRAVIQTANGDAPADFAERLPGVDLVLIPLRGPGDLLAKRLRRYIDSRRTDPEWWTA